jgi:predicted outer membrane lipoprotein
MRTGKDIAAAFGVVSAIVMVWQLIEMSRDKERAGREGRELLARLERIEKKISGKA